MGLTFFRLLMLPVFLWILLNDAGDRQHGLPDRGRWFAIGVFAIMAITDKLDGWLARKLNQTSNLGAWLDPVADKLLVASSVVLLSFDWIAPEQLAIPRWVVIAIYGKDVIVVIGVVLLIWLTGSLRVSARTLGKVCTGFQLALVISMLVGPDLIRLLGPWVLWLRDGMFWVTTGICIAATIDYIVMGVRHFKAWKQGNIPPRDAELPLQ
jgi:CDP-diacylglycerol--glycerol-3-phosphate 3-phosphatidyltransferase